MKIKHSFNSPYVLLSILTFAVAIGLQGWRTVFNNFAVADVGINGAQMGALQGIREIPGFLSLLVVFLLYFIKENRLIIYSALLLGIGVFLTGFTPSFFGLIISITILSVGFHFFETTRQSLVLQYFDDDCSAMVLGKLRSYAAIANIGIGLIIIGLNEFVGYKELFISIGIIVILLVIASTRVKLSPPEEHELQHKKIIFRKKYWIYYLLNFLSGARRQIFVVFSIFLMVEKYHFSVQLISALFVVNNIVNAVLAPLIARMIINIGEKKVLVAGYTCIFFIFLLYAIVDNPVLIAVLYICDNIFFNINIGIRTYFKKHADKRDIASGMAAGFTINHVTAVIFPLIAGYFWLYSVKIPFLLGAVIAVLSLIAAMFMKSEKRIGKRTELRI